MKSNIIAKIFFSILLMTPFALFSNNIKIDTAPTTTDIDPINHCMNITFDMSWDNSWRTVTNFDAAWIFVKYKKNNDPIWYHAYLSTNLANHSITTDNGVPASFYVGKTNVAGTDRGMGVFAYRTNNGTGSNNFDGVKLRWFYNENSLTESDSIQVKVYAIETVYVPQDAFYVGDGVILAGDIKGQLHNANNSANPLQITSENALTLGGLIVGNIGNNNASGMTTADDFNNITTQTLPAAFPKGYNAFFCMKYEISQWEYVEFLNSLNRLQQVSRVFTNISIGTTIVVNRYVMANNLALFFRNGIRCDGNIDANNAVTFYSDFNGNGIGNEIDDGQTTACNYLSYNDIAAYGDWTGMRPMSELEFEKVCRGPSIPIINERAWGTTVINSATGINNLGLESEIASNSPANCNTWTALLPNDNSHRGPLRCGSFATGITLTREQSGASYYGALDLSGNVTERAISIGNVSGRNFTGEHGDGILNNNGDADVTNWPSASGSVVRGGVFSNPAGGNQQSVSVRQSASIGLPDRANPHSGRLVRTAP